MMLHEAGKTAHPLLADHGERPYSGDTEFVGEAGLLIASGVMDLCTAPRFAQDLDKVMSLAPADVVLDLCDVDLIDATTLGVILLARQRLEDEGRYLILVVENRQVSRTLLIAGLRTAFPLVASRREALQQVSSLSDPARAA